jgi:hypothetical protein
VARTPTAEREGGGEPNEQACEFTQIVMGGAAPPADDGVDQTGARRAAVLRGGSRVEARKRAAGEAGLRGPNAHSGA